MTDLAACYFCGVALDEPLSPVTLGDGPDAATVTLCRGCREKLETVVEAMDLRPAGADTSDSEPAGSAAADRAHADSAERDGPTSDASAAADRGASTDEPETPDGPTPTTSPDIDADVETSSDEAADAGRDDPVAGQTDAPAEAGASAEGDGETDASDGGDEPVERSIAAGDQELSALEYNKVMRLLQNREFPVDREEFVTVAANAYEVSRADCDRVIDVAIDRGLLDEADGALVSGD